MKDFFMKDFFIEIYIQTLLKEMRNLNDREIIISIQR